MELAMGVIDAAFTTGLLIASCGGSAAMSTAKTAGKKLAAKTISKRQAKRLNRQNAMKVGRKGFMDKVKEAGKYWIKDVLAGNLKGKVSEKTYSNIVRYSELNQEALTEEMKKKIQARESSESIVFKEIDPIGLVNAIDSSTGDSVDAPNVQAGKWADVLSVGDPTGIVGAVAGFLKVQYCEDMEKEAKDAVRKHTPNNEMDLIAEELETRNLSCTHWMDVNSHSTMLDLYNNWMSYIHRLPSGTKAIKMSMGSNDEYYKPSNAGDMGNAIKKWGKAFTLSHCK
jgi:hypothetical protein